MTAPAHDTEAGYSVEQVHRLQPGMIRPQFRYPPCYDRRGVYRRQSRPVPWVVAVLVVVGLSLAIRVVA